MPQPTRRSMVQTALLGAAVLAASASLPRRALAADALQDVKFPQDPKNLQPGLEAAHTPSIAIEKVDARTVAYGKTPAGDFYRVTIQARHEATKEHFMDGIALFVNGEPMATHTMSRVDASASLPVAAFVQRLKAGDEVVAVTSCNLHGKWGSKAIV
ncbi:MAG TPA: desulfoferrodoxin family protein [Albitalea sp.]